MVLEFGVFLDGSLFLNVKYVAASMKTKSSVAFGTSYLVIVSLFVFMYVNVSKILNLLMSLCICNGMFFVDVLFGLRIFEFAATKVACSTNVNSYYVGNLSD